MRNVGHLTQHKRKSALTLGSSTGGARSALPLRAAELGLAPGVPRHAPRLIVVHPAGEAFNDGLQFFESGLQHSLRDSLRCLWPEARQDKAGL